MSSTDERYAKLRDVLDRAYVQASKYKGDKRHGSDEPFERQWGCRITRELGLGFPLGQCMKKVLESQRLEGSATVTELLGVIVYAAIAIIVFEEKGEAIHGDSKEKE